jgi:hypothetical protein
LKLRREVDQGFVYDHVVRTRTDVRLSTELDLARFMPMTREFVVFPENGHWRGGLNDQFRVFVLRADGCLRLGDRLYPLTLRRRLPVSPRDAAEVSSDENAYSAHSRADQRDRDPPMILVFPQASKALRPW